MRPGVKELQIPSKAFLEECLEYDPDTGVFTWKARPRHHFGSERSWFMSNRLSKGRKAGCVHFQYGKAACVQIRIDNKLYRAHRLAFRMMGVDIPEGMLGDHINRDPTDNRWSNLRIATRTQNNRNGSRRRNNKSGVPGVQPSVTPGKYVASIMVDHKSLHLGTFNTKEEAIAVRRNAELANFKEYAPR